MLNIVVYYYYELFITYIELRQGRFFVLPDCSPILDNNYQYAMIGQNVENPYRM